MERRYLAATLAMAATFAIVTHGFNSGMLAQLQHRPTALVSELRCTAETLSAKLLNKLNRSFAPQSAEEAQLRVELNLPAPLAAVPPIPPVPPALMAPPSQAFSSPGANCPSRHMTTGVRIPNLAQMQAKLAAMQLRLQSQEMQRELARAAKEEARANRLQVRFNTLPCRGFRSVGRSSGQNFDFDYDRLAHDISEQVNRSLNQSFRDF